MKRQWDIEELIESFTLLSNELDFLANKTGATRLGCAVLLKCFQYEGRFPSARHEIPKDVVNYVANQLKLDTALFAQYDWDGRTIKSHRTQIRELLEYREATAIDTKEMKTWLISEKLASDQNLEHLKAIVTKAFRDLKIEPPAPDRMERFLHSACTTYEQLFFEEVLRKSGLTSWAATTHEPCSCRSRSCCVNPRICVKFYREDLASGRVLYVYPGLPSERGNVLKE